LQKKGKKEEEFLHTLGLVSAVAGVAGARHDD